MMIELIGSRKTAPLPARLLGNFSYFIRAFPFHRWGTRSFLNAQIEERARLHRALVGLCSEGVGRGGSSWRPETNESLAPGPLTLENRWQNQLCWLPRRTRPNGIPDDNSCIDPYSWPVPVIHGKEARPLDSTLNLSAWGMFSGTSIMDQTV